MILTTTNSIEGFKILEYKGIVSGIAVNMQKMSISFNMEKYYAGISESMSQVKEQAFQELQNHARKLNANAVVGIKVDMEVTVNNCITVSVTGTAVSVA
ncbi:heavy metal-binding domain-containing protein [uncultured Gelidibacter sp.]|uniref:YbjQ family protein n=1 Tax=uncultured Gelidibacter sp. TaxID=259318 RepID=UPI002626EC00|nr:heavy metal-binding domain-containing protein [uncultured Gelidibacter sp.]